jgi:hypothetical protein
MVGRIELAGKDPATYRILELLAGKARDFLGSVVDVPKIGDLYVYAAGSKICAASPTDTSPSNTDWIKTAPASYTDNGVFEGSIIFDADRQVTEIGLILIGPSKFLLAKTCLSQSVNISAGDELKIVVRFTLL